MTHADILNFLISLPLFQQSDRILLKKAVESEHTHLVTLSSGEALPDRYGEMLGVVLSGRMQILSMDTDHPVVLRAVTAGHVFGAASLFLENAAPVSRLVAQSDCSLFFLARNAVRELLGHDPAFLDAYLRFLAERVHFLNGKIRSFTAGSTERRLALWLAEHAENGSVRAVSLSVLAGTLDIGRASLYRALDKLEAEGLITRNGREIAVPSLEALLQKYSS